MPPTILSQILSQTYTIISNLENPTVFSQKSPHTRNIEGSIINLVKNIYKKLTPRKFPEGPVVRPLCFHCRGLGFSHWSRSSDPASHVVHPKEKKRKSITKNPRLKPY